MKRSILLLISVSVMESTFAFDFSTNGIFYKIKTPLSSNEVAVTAGSATSNNYSDVVVIPSSVTYNAKNYSVTEIDSWAFGSSYSLTDVTIPSSIDTIGDGAFWGCIKLKTFAIAASVKKIGNYVFMGCTGLTDFGVDATNSNYKSDLGVLYNKVGSTLLLYPAGKPALSYSIANTVDTIEGFAFSYCKLTSITIPNTVKYMAHGTFSFCDGLTSVYLPASLTFLNNNPFYDCKGMTAVTVDPANQYNESLDGVLFKKATNKGLETIIYYPPAKSGSSYVIPSTVTYIRSSTFMNCLNLNTVTIPASVKTIRSGILQGCKNLTTINSYAEIPVDLTSTVPGENSDKVFDGVDTVHCILHVPVGSRSLYANAFQWKGFSNIVEGFTAEVTTPKTHKLKVVAQNGQIQLSGYYPNELITVFNTQGATLYKQRASTATTIINLSCKGVFVIKAGTENAKAALY
jgi:hypothetical protein